MNYWRGRWQHDRSPYFPDQQDGARLMIELIATVAILTSLAIMATVADRLPGRR